MLRTYSEGLEFDERNQHRSPAESGRNEAIKSIRTGIDDDEPPRSGLRSQTWSPDGERPLQLAGDPPEKLDEPPKSTQPDADRTTRITDENTKQEIEKLGIDPNAPGDVDAVNATMQKLATMEWEKDANGRPIGRLKGEPPSQEELDAVLTYYFVTHRDPASRGQNKFDADQAETMLKLYAALDQRDDSFLDLEYPLRLQLMQAMKKDIRLWPVVVGWDGMPVKAKQLAMNRVKQLFEEIYGLDGELSLKFVSTNQEGRDAVFVPDSGEGLGHIAVDIDSTPSGGLDQIGLLLHELEHAYQTNLIDRFRAGDLSQAILSTKW